MLLIGATFFEFPARLLANSCSAVDVHVAFPCTRGISNEIHNLIFKVQPRQNYTCAYDVIFQKSLLSGSVSPVMGTTVILRLSLLRTSFSKILSRSLRLHTAKLTLILLMWRIWWASNNVSKWKVGFNSAFKGLKASYSANRLLFLRSKAAWTAY